MHLARATSSRGLLLVLHMLLMPGLARAAQFEGATARQRHDWGRFAPGAWKRVRTFTDSLDVEGKVAKSSITETTTTLLSSDDASCTLRVESVVDVAGKRIVAEPQEVTLRYEDDFPAGPAEGDELPSESVLIDGVAYACRVRQSETSGAATRTTTRIHYSRSVMPYVLRRHSVTVDLETQAQTAVSLVEVIALDMPFLVCGEIKPTIHVKTWHKHPKGSSVTLAISSPEVPGGLVAHTSKELDAEGRIVQRHMLELAAYGLAQDEPPRRNPRRLRLFRRSP